MSEAEKSSSMLDEKLQAKKQWNNQACGQVGDVEWSLEYFNKVASNRYDEYGKWMKSYYRYDDHEGVRLLGVGFGQGTDLVQYCQGGAECFGVDLTENHYQLAQANFKLRGLDADLRLADAANLPFEDNFFDKVVSFGVLHHTPDIEKCVAEIHRVLKPGGQLVLSLYHRNSLYYWISILLKKGILQGKLLTIGHSGIKSLIEKGADGKNIKPYVKLYTRSSISQLTKDFKIDKIDIKHLRKKDLWVFGLLTPNWLLDKLERYFGWYIIVTCTK